MSFKYSKFTMGGNMTKILPKNIPIYKTNIEKGRGFIITAAAYSAAAAILGLYFTEWRVICEFIPFYRDKFYQDEEEIDKNADD